MVYQQRGFLMNLLRRICTKMAAWFNFFKKIFTSDYPATIRQQLNVRYKEIHFHEKKIRQLEKEIEIIKRSYENC